MEKKLIDYGVNIGFYIIFSSLEGVYKCYKYIGDDFIKTPFTYVLEDEKNNKVFYYHHYKSVIKKISEIINDIQEEERKVCYKMYYRDGTFRFFETEFSNFKNEILKMAKKNYLELFLPYGFIDMNFPNMVEVSVNELLRSSEMRGQRLKLVKVELIKSDD